MDEDGSCTSRVGGGGGGSGSRHILVLLLLLPARSPNPSATFYTHSLMLFILSMGSGRQGVSEFLGSSLLFCRLVLSGSLLLVPFRTTTIIIIYRAGHVYSLSVAAPFR